MSKDCDVFFYAVVPIYIKYNFSGDFQIILLDEQKAVSSSKTRNRISTYYIFWHTAFCCNCSKETEIIKSYRKNKFAFLIIWEGSIKSRWSIFDLFSMSLLYFHFSFVFALTSKFIEINTLKWLLLRIFSCMCTLKSEQGKQKKSSSHYEIACSTVNL